MTIWLSKPPRSKFHSASKTLPDPTSQTEMLTVYLEVLEHVSRPVQVVQLAHRAIKGPQARPLRVPEGCNEFVEPRPSGLV